MPLSLSLGFDDLACFVAVAERGSFTAAAAELRVRKPTVSRHIQQLEHRLGIQLVVRTTRAVKLTENGRTYLAHAKRAVEAARAATRAVADSGAGGTLRITTTPFFGDVLMAPVLCEYLRSYPLAAVDLELTRDTVDLVSNDFDIAIRFGKLADSTMRARKIGAAYVGCFASPAYLASRGTPAIPADLQHHDVIGMTHGKDLVSWSFHRSGKRVVIERRARLGTSSMTLAETAARASLGIVRLPGPVARVAVERGKLVPVLTDWATPLIPVQVVMPQRSPQPTRTRAFVDLLVAEAARGPLGQLGMPGRTTRSRR